MPVQKTSTTRYPDLALFLALIPFISAFNFYLTYVNIRLDTFHLIRFAVDTLQGYAAWLGVRAIILYLGTVTESSLHAQAENAKNAIYDVLLK
jgi:hypothetical protein